MFALFITHNLISKNHLFARFENIELNNFYDSQNPYAKFNASFNFTKSGVDFTCYLNKFDFYGVPIIIWQNKVLAYNNALIARKGGVDLKESDIKLFLNGRCQKQGENNLFFLKLPSDHSYCKVTKDARKHAAHLARLNKIAAAAAAV